jgi:2-polyprenyl-6-methoxyphenol hydroxylase-like FAD-dependent oxidoreductase
VDRWSNLRPDNWESFHVAFRRLITPTLFDTLRHAKPLDGIRHYGFRASVWKHFERLRSLPRGVLPIADALCRFNPIHGQGMSSAAKQARLLQTMLGRATAEADPLAATQAGFMAGVESVLQTPWNMSTNGRRISTKAGSSRPLFSVPLSPIRSSIAP